VRRPELAGVERGIGIRDDRGDAVADARLVPGLRDQRLERSRVVEHAAA
jgi:hypothetical protein